MRFGFGFWLFFLLSRAFGLLTTMEDRSNILLMICYDFYAVWGLLFWPILVL